MRTYSVDEESALAHGAESGAFIDRVWKGLKRWRRVPLGPVTLHYLFRRTVGVKRSRRSAPSTAIQALDQPVAHQPQATLAGVAVIMGAGPGLGQTLAAHLAAAGMMVVLVSRDATHQESTIDAIRKSGGRAFAYACDATDEKAVEALLDVVTARWEAPSLVVYSLQWFARTQSLHVSVPEFEDSLRHNCLGPFLLARAAGRSMAAAGAGTIVLIGSTSSLLGREEHLSFAVGKFGARALAQVLTRELWPLGVHVAHLVIDADIREGEAQQHPQADPQHIAQAIEFLHRQPASAWTSELDIRPFNERFWEHC